MGLPGSVSLFGLHHFLLNCSRLCLGLCLGILCFKHLLVVLNLVCFCLILLFLLADLSLGFWLPVDPFSRLVSLSSARPAAWQLPAILAASSSVPLSAPPFFNWAMKCLRAFHMPAWCELRKYPEPCSSPSAPFSIAIQMRSGRNFPELKKKCVNTTPL